MKYIKITLSIFSVIFAMCSVYLYNKYWLNPEFTSYEKVFKDTHTHYIRQAYNYCSLDIKQKPEFNFPFYQERQNCINSWYVFDASKNIYKWSKITFDEKFVIGSGWNSSLKYIYSWYNCSAYTNILLEKVSWTWYFGCNGKDIFHDKMYLWGLNSPVRSVWLVNNKMFITYQYAIASYQNSVITSKNIYYDWESINAKYNLHWSKEIFEYKGIIWFVWNRWRYEYIYFDGKPITPWYAKLFGDKTCCTNASLPYYIYDNGMMEFVVIDDDKYYIWQVNLNEYL